MLKNKDILIVVDMQNDFITGSLAIPRAETLPGKISAKIKEFFEKNGSCGEVFFTMDTHYSNYLDTREGRYLPVKHCIECTPGWCVVDELFEWADDFGQIIKKKDFAVHDWDNYIRGIYKIEPTQIEICGVATDICVISNAIILRQIFREIPIKVYADLCAGTTSALHEAALQVMESCQIEIVR